MTRILKHLALPLGCLFVLNASTEKRHLNVVQNTSSVIDQAVEKDLAKKNLKPFPIIDDSTFLRRAYLNITGRIPTHAEATAFLKDASSEKRARLIDKLVYSKGFESKMFYFWADLLRLDTNLEQAGLGWGVWIRNSVKENKPYDQFVYEMLSAKGHASKNPAVGYYLRDRNMLLDNVSNSVQVFLGTQIGCAQCHDHPFEDWTQKEYYELASFGGHIDFRSTTAQTKVREASILAAKRDGVNLKDPKLNKNKKKGLYRKYNRDLYTLFRQYQKNEISMNDTKVLKLPHDYQYNDAKPGDVMKPGVIFGTMPKLKEGEDKQVAFARWVTSKDNPQFTKTIANRLWKHVYGYGLAEPIDNWTDRTKVSHPEALALVEKILHANNFNIKETLRVLYHTKLFQRKAATQAIVPGSVYEFQGPVLRRLTAEEIHDSLLTLEKGNVDGLGTQYLASKWNAYTNASNGLMNAPAATILKMDDLADKTEKDTNELRAKARDLRLARDKATGDGDQERLKKVNAQLKEVYDKLNNKKKQSSMAAMKESPEMAQAVSMMSQNRMRIRMKNPVRASELTSPFKSGSFLHQFGASDRKTSNAAQTNASIPQTLTLLNGREIVSATDKNGELPKLLKSCNSPSEKLDALFISIYATYPTEAERTKYEPMMKNPKDIIVLSKAMINSKRFLFSQ